MVNSNYGNSPVLPFIIITKCTEQRAALPDVRNAKNQPESLCCFFFFFLLYSFSHRPEKLITTPPSAHTAQPSRKKTTRKNNNTICSICRNNRDERAFGTRRCKGDTGCSQDAAAAAVESLRASTKTCTQIIYNKYAKLVHMCVSVCVCVFVKKGLNSSIK